MALFVKFRSRRTAILCLCAYKMLGGVSHTFKIDGRRRSGWHVNREKVEVKDHVKKNISPVAACDRPFSLGKRGEHVRARC